MTVKDSKSMGFLIPTVNRRNYGSPQSAKLLVYGEKRQKPELICLQVQLYIQRLKSYFLKFFKFLSYGSK